MLEDVLDMREYSRRQRDGQIGGLTFTFHPVQHYILSHAMRVRGRRRDAGVFVGRRRRARQLVEAARGADLFLCESALLDASQDEPDPARRGHMSAAEAGEAAREAGARRLLITHYRSGETHDAHHLDAASRAFGGPVELAREGKTYVVG